MDDTPIASLMERFSKLKDPRVDRAKRHKLIDLVVIAICAVICGADTWGGRGVVRQVKVRSGSAC